MIRSTPLLAALALLSSPAAADKLRVPQDHGSIQAAIDAAVPGDVVLVSGGPYAEELLIDGRERITLKGQGKPVVRGAAGTLLTITGGSSNIIVDGLVFDDAGDFGVLVKGSTDITIKRCEVRNTEDGIRLEASTRVLVEKNKLENVRNDSIDMDSQGGTIPPNVDCRIMKNRISSAGEDAIDLNGRDHWVAKNRIEVTADEGIEAQDPNTFGILIEKNRIDRAGRFGINANGTAHTISKNRLTDGGDDAIRIRGADFLVEKNKVDRAGEDGIDVEGPDHDVIKNKIKQPAQDGIEVGADTSEDATGNFFEKNKVSQAGGDGFRISDGLNTFQKNKTTQSSGFGAFDNAGTGSNTYLDNKFDSESIP